MRPDLVASAARLVSDAIASGSPDFAIPRCLERLGLLLHLDRLYLCELKGQDAPLPWALSHLWEQVPSPPPPPSPHGDDRIHNRAFARWHLLLLERTPLISDLAGLPEDERAALEPLGVRSLFLLPLEVDGRLWGALGAESHRADRVWSDDDKEILALIGITLASLCVRAWGEQVARQAVVASEKSHRERIHAELNAAREALDLAGRSQNEFLAMMSHELRTPLNAILGFNGLLNTTELDKEQTEYVETIEQSGKFLLHLINQLLDFSKISSTHPTVCDEEEFSLRSLVGDTVKLVTGKYMNRPNSVDISIGDNLPDTYLGDPGRLTQVIANLVDNAFKFGGDQRIAVRADGQPAHTAPSPGDRIVWELRITVEDSGVGIPDDKIEEIFLPFRQLDSSPTRKFGGAGLGLAICRRIVELMRGRIWAESSEGHGTRMQFVVQLPAAERATERECRHSPAPLVDGRIYFPRMRVLVVDDDDANLRLMCSYLSKLGHTSGQAQNGVEAVQQLLQDDYDAVLLDIQMPKPDGIEVTKRIRAGVCGDTNRRIYILGVTAHVLAGDRRICLDAGMDGYLPKPFSANQLESALLRIVQHRQLPYKVSSVP